MLLRVQQDCVRDLRNLLTTVEHRPYFEFYLISVNSLLPKCLIKTQVQYTIDR